MRLLVTGGTGFIGRNVVEAGRALDHEVVSAGHGAAADLQADLRDPEAARELVRAARPEAVIHLAGYAHVGWARAHPAEATALNVLGSVHLLQAIADAAPDARVVLASTGEVYMRSDHPIDEDALVAPTNPYGLSKMQMEHWGHQFALQHGLDVGVVRSFAVCGAGQGAAFAISNFARQMAVAVLAKQPRVELRTGRKTTARDYSGVLEVAHAYLVAAEKRGLPGPWNLGRGEARTTEEIITMLGEVAGIGIDHVEDPQLVRRDEAPIVVAQPRRARVDLRWDPWMPFDLVLSGALEWWVSELKRAPEQGEGIFG